MSRPRRAKGARGDARDDDRARSRRIGLILGQIDSLPTLPSVATRLLKVGSSSDADFREIVSMIESDPALTAKILGLCRRADRKRAEEITTVDRAVVHLGFEAVRSAALSVHAYELLSVAGAERSGSEDISPALDPRQFWRHSIAVACAAEGLVAANDDPAGLPKPTAAFVCGLLHGIGTLALQHALPRAYAKAIEVAAHTGEDLALVERRFIGVDHHAAGRRLAEKWDLPPMLLEVIWLCGLPTEALPALPNRRVVALINAAVAVARRQHLGWAGDPAHLGAPEALCAEAGISRAALAEVEAKLHDEVAARTALLGIDDVPTDRLVLDSLGQANTELDRTRAVARRERSRADRLTLALDEAATFRGAWAHGLDESAECVARSVGRTLSAGFVAVAWRESSDAPWDIRRFETTREGARALTTRRIEAAAPWESAPDEGVDADDLARVIGAASGALRIAHLPDSNDQCFVIHDGADLETFPDASRDALLGLWAGAMISGSRWESLRALRNDADSAGAHASELSAKLASLATAERRAAFARLVALEAARPLSLLRARAEVLQQTLSQQRDLRNVDAITNSGGRLETLMAALSLTVDPPKPTLAPAELAPLLGRAIREAMKRVGSNPKRASQPRIRLLVDEAVKTAVVDADRLSGAVAELVANCLEIPEVSLIEVDAHNDPETGRLVLCVRDDGPGMAPEALAKAFEPFALPKKNTQRKGLGLVMAQRLLAVAGGRLTVANGPNAKGLVATITVHASEEPAQDAPAATLRPEDPPARSAA